MCQSVLWSMSTGSWMWIVAIGGSIYFAYGLSTWLYRLNVSLTMVCIVLLLSCWLMVSFLLLPTSCTFSCLVSLVFSTIVPTQICARSIVLRMAWLIELPLVFCLLTIMGFFIYASKYVWKVRKIMLNITSFLLYGWKMINRSSRVHLFLSIQYACFMLIVFVLLMLLLMMYCASHAYPVIGTLFQSATGDMWCGRRYYYFRFRMFSFCPSPCFYSCRFATQFNIHWNR